ncbi:MAG: phage holin family protein [Clostridia bacterium]|nr:phage holin family protein [Clostridia bacterium]
MPDNQTNTTSRSNTYSGIFQFVGRFITAAVVLAITAFFTPGFQIENIWTLAVATLVLTLIDFLISRFTGLNASPFGKGFVGFILSAVTLYVTQYFVAGYTISWVAAIVGALIYGVVDYLLPGDQHM